MLTRDLPIGRLIEAPYNPREISAESLAALESSLRMYGVLKPIIVAREGTIIAGHQRTRACKAIGVDAVTVYVVRKVDEGDEVRFNQLHNACDDVSRGGRVTPGTGKFVYVSHRDIVTKEGGPGVTVRNAICDLIQKYGNYGCVVASESGEILDGTDYAMSCKLLRIPAMVSYVRDSDAAGVVAAFRRTYGEFSYVEVARNTSVQTFAQIRRLRGKSKEVRSPGYELVIIPWMKANAGGVLDFGAGQRDYARRYADRVVPWEPFPRVGSAVNQQAAEDMTMALIDHLYTDGRFHAAIADYVANSVNSVQAAADVMIAMNALCAPGATVVFSGRRAEFVERLRSGYKTRASARIGRHLEFLDSNGFSALKRHGSWFFQRFTTDAQEDAMLSEYWGEGTIRRTSAEWQCSCSKSIELLPSARDAVVREFDLAGEGLGQQVWDAVVTAAAKEEE